VHAILDSLCAQGFRLAIVWRGCAAGSDEVSLGSRTGGGARSSANHRMGMISVNQMLVHLAHCTLLSSAGTDVASAGQRQPDHQLCPMGHRA
jgi:hypothetical protein